jgi:phosphoglycolate phosphatase
MKNFDAAILDLDGTLVDTLDDFVAALRAMLQDLPAPYCHFELDRATVEPLVGKGSENLIKSLFALMDRADEATELLATANQRYQAHYREVNGRYATLYPGALAGVQQLHALGLPLACVTNKPTAFAQDLLAQKGLAGYFSMVLGGDAVARKKPDPLPLLMACQHLGSAPARTWMVGDSSNDAQAARAAGCPVLLVTYGYNHGQPVREVDADAFADTLATVPWEQL